MTTKTARAQGGGRSRKGLLKRLAAPVRPLDAPIWLRLGTFAVVLAIGVLIPLNSPTYVNFDLSMVMVYAIVGMGLNLLTGFNGQISLGHSAFFATGAYIAAVMIKNDYNYLLTIPIAVVVTWVLGYLFGMPALRLRGLQLALVTLSLAIVTPALIKRLDNITKGQEGINVFLPEPPAWTGLAADQWVYFICLIALAIAWILTRRLSTGRVGRSLVGIRNNELVAQTLGVRASRVKTGVFALSAAYAGFAGVLYTYVVQFVGPDSFGLVMAITFISIIVVGGLGTISGAILGAAFIQYLPKVTSGAGDSAAGFFYGLALVAFMFLMPSGIAGLINLALGPMVRRLPGRRPLAAAPVGSGDMAQVADAPGDEPAEPAEGAAEPGAMSAPRAGGADSSG
ncbi:branched-chain amino acid ABC transporter permease [Cumulibacter manganitolerans]|uniref:branched-chain amino acid ABC transporter permease n=1 Tax=Cumulibacter manganitolerans TaxID=1884992 RepID=UPI001295EFFC|nr:branched-chain amino acid ABC transporter permease [Cumulibacter manganitolerans]